MGLIDVFGFIVDVILWCVKFLMDSLSNNVAYKPKALLLSECYIMFNCRKEHGQNSVVIVVVSRTTSMRTKMDYLSIRVDTSSYWHRSAEIFRRSKGMTDIHLNIQQDDASLWFFEQRKHKASPGSSKTMSTDDFADK
jgi:hypothetical protein